MIRIIHNLGGCGGTLLSRCLGVLPAVAILSEINPGAVKLFPHFDPLYQDEKWIHLLAAGDREEYSQLDLLNPDNFRELMGVFYDRAVAAGRSLILRDFNYLDFVGMPFASEPPTRLTIYEALPPQIPTRSIAFIRHPIDQYMSLCKHVEIGPYLKPSTFCDAYLLFLESVEGTKLYRYEDFVSHPDAQMQDICTHLNLPFEPSFRQRFHTFDSITGDFMRLRETSISVPEKKVICESLMNEFSSSHAFYRLLRLTGYAELSYA